MTVSNLIVNNWGAIAGTGGGMLLLNAFVGALPPKDVKIKSFGDFVRIVYGTVYDFLHLFVSFKGGQAPPPPPTPPVTPAQQIPIKL
jgi:hypothetical protein